MGLKQPLSEQWQNIEVHFKTKTGFNLFYYLKEMISSFSYPLTLIIFSISCLPVLALLKPFVFSLSAEMLLVE